MKYNDDKKNWVTELLLKQFISIFIYDQHSDAVTSSDYITLIDRMINKYWIWKYVKRIGLGQIGGIEET